MIYGLCKNAAAERRQTKMTARKKAALALTVLFVFVMLFSHIFVIAEVDHECSGDDCPICEVIAIVSDKIKGLSLVGSSAIICAAIIFYIVKTLFVGNEAKTVSSLITLKVKLSN